MNVRLRRPFFSPAFSVYDLPEITSPSRKRKLTAVCSHQTRIGNLDAHLI